MKLSVIIPCFNEAENIPLILERFAHVIGRWNIELILVNNGSTDHSEKVLEVLLPQYAFARTVFVPENQGYGYGILSGLKEADGDYLGWTHADMQTDPADIVRAWRILENNFEKPVYIKGARKKRPLFDTFFTIGMSIFESIYFRISMKDINAQPNIFPKSFYLKWKNPPFDFSLDLYALYMAKKEKITIIRFPVLFPKRIHGTSKWNTGFSSKWKFIKRTIEYSRKLKKKM